MKNRCAFLLVIVLVLAGYSGLLYVKGYALKKELDESLNQVYVPVSPEKAVQEAESNQTVAEFTGRFKRFTRDYTSEPYWNARGW